MSAAAIHNFELAANNSVQQHFDANYYSEPPSPSSSNIVISPAGIIHVLGYTPTEGEDGAPISVRIHFHPDYAETIYVRLVVGHRAVATTVRELKEHVYGRWQLDAVVPAFNQLQSASQKVLISVQALNEDNAILDSATFGEFSYWAPSQSSVSLPPCSSLYPQDLSGPSSLTIKREQMEEVHPHRESIRESNRENKKPKLRINTTGPPHPCRRRVASHLPTPSPTSPNHPRFPSSKAQPEIQLHRRTKADTHMRSKGNGSDIHCQTPILDLVTNLQTICVGWTPAEIAAGRRLVRFSKVQDGRRLIVSCAPIRAEQYRDTDSVISCIYREESDSCFVTSVDIIFLLERLASSDFPVEEKNRIRRNLEGLRPTTVSKHKSGFEDFFQRIMEFPDPKPRNIEKDLKVFEWSLLDQALDKILSKYTIDVSSKPPASANLDLDAESSGEASPSSASDDLDLEYPTSYQVKTEEPPNSAYSDLSSATKFEQIPETLQFLSSSDGSESYYSPIDSNYQLYTPDLHTQQAGESSPSSWGSEYKPGDLGPLDQYTYEVVPSSSGVIGNYVDYAYDGLAYSGMQGEMGLVDHHYL